MPIMERKRITLSIHGRPQRSVFHLLGIKENSATFALGWALQQSVKLRALLVKQIFDEELEVDNAVFALQKHAEDGGYTDLELQAGMSFHAIIEAKRGWEVPGVAQLTRYHERLRVGGAERRRMVSLSAADKAYAERHLTADIGGIGIRHLSWIDLRRLAVSAQGQTSSFEEKLWLRQLVNHLEEFVAMERQNDNSVYVVSLGRHEMNEGGAYTWIDVVEKDRCYFHPVGNTWPVQPPNYVGFRYYGKLQSIHHVDAFKVVKDVSDINPKWVETDGDHFVYHLGPPMRPAKEVRTGSIFKNGRVWCAIDALLSGAFDTISAARDETLRRNSEIG